MAFSLPCLMFNRRFLAFVVQLLSLHPDAFKLKLLGQWKWVVWILLRTTKEILFLVKNGKASIQGMGRISAFNYYSETCLRTSKIIGKRGFKLKKLAYLLIKK